MNPDPRASGEVGLLTGILLYILFAWLLRAQKRKLSKLEEKGFDIFAFLTVYLALLPFHLMFGFLIIGTAVFISPYVKSITSIDINAFVKTYIWVDGSAYSFVWTAVIGALPSFYGFYKSKKEEKNET